MEQKWKLLFRVWGLGYILPLKYIEYEVYGDLILVYPKPYSIYFLRGTITLNLFATGFLRPPGLGYSRSTAL